MTAHGCSSWDKGICNSQHRPSLHLMNSNHTRPQRSSRLNRQALREAASFNRFGGVLNFVLPMRTYTSLQEGSSVRQLNPRISLGALQLPPSLAVLFWHTKRFRNAHPAKRDVGLVPGTVFVSTSVMGKANPPTTCRNCHYNEKNRKRSAIHGQNSYNYGVTVITTQFKRWRRPSGSTS